MNLSFYVRFLVFELLSIFYFTVVNSDLAIPSILLKLTMIILNNGMLSNYKRKYIKKFILNGIVVWSFFH